MKSVERLIAEHDLIERGLSLVEKSVGRIETGKTVPDGFPQWAPQFFQHFADQCHHAKEEDAFFPVLKQRGIPEEVGPIGVMLHEHVLGRECVGEMRTASHPQPFDAAKFSAAAKQYIPLRSAIWATFCTSMVSRIEMVSMRHFISARIYCPIGDRMRGSRMPSVRQGNAWKRTCHHLR